MTVSIVTPVIANAQCAVCNASVESSTGQKNSVAKGLNKGILLFCHFGGHSYIYNIAEAFMNASVR